MPWIGPRQPHAYCRTCGELYSVHIDTDPHKCPDCTNWGAAFVTAPRYQRHRTHYLSPYGLAAMLAGGTIGLIAGAAALVVRIGP